jgi:hypothetical protein
MFDQRWSEIKVSRLVIFRFVLILGTSMKFVIPVVLANPGAAKGLRGPTNDKQWAVQECAHTAKKLNVNAIFNCWDCYCNSLSINKFDDSMRISSTCSKTLLGRYRFHGCKLRASIGSLLWRRRRRGASSLQNLSCALHLKIIFRHFETLGEISWTYFGDLEIEWLRKKNLEKRRCGEDEWWRKMWLRVKVLQTWIKHELNRLTEGTPRLFRLDNIVCYIHLNTSMTSMHSFWNLPMIQVSLPIYCNFSFGSLSLNSCMYGHVCIHHVSKWWAKLGQQGAGRFAACLSTCTRPAPEVFHICSYAVEAGSLQITALVTFLPADLSSANAILFYIIMSTHVKLYRCISDTRYE